MFPETGFYTIIANDDQHERVFCEIYFNKKFFALISEERGEGIFDIETYGPGFVEELIARKMDLVEFQKSVQEACERLKSKTSLFSLAEHG